MFVKALEYETVNLDVDPREVVGKKFDPNTKREILITRAGTELDVRSGVTDSPTITSDKPNGMTYHNGPDMEMARERQASQVHGTVPVP
jgi:hypothetical protein